MSQMFVFLVITAYGLVDTNVSQRHSVSIFRRWRPTSISSPPWKHISKENFQGCITGEIIQDPWIQNAKLLTGKAGGIYSFYPALVNHKQKFIILLTNTLLIVQRWIFDNIYVTKFTTFLCFSAFLKGPHLNLSNCNMRSTHRPILL
jgi:hypothetical protein